MFDDTGKGNPIIDPLTGRSTELTNSWANAPVQEWHLRIFSSAWHCFVWEWVNQWTAKIQSAWGVSCVGGPPRRGATHPFLHPLQTLQILIGKVPLVTEVKGIGVLVLERRSANQISTKTEAQAIRESRNMRNYSMSVPLRSFLRKRSCPCPLSLLRVTDGRANPDRWLECRAIYIYRICLSVWLSV